MSKELAEVRRIVLLTFPPERSNQPLVCTLVSRFALRFSILQAQIAPNKEGRLTLELWGAPEQYRAGVEYLRENYVTVRLVSRSVSRDDDNCMHCGECTALCPTRSLSVDLTTRRVNFNKDTCTACGQCARVCPVHVIQVDTLL